MSPNAMDMARKERRKPTWEMALLFPSQGDWSEQEYLALPTNRLVEYSSGRLEFLPMPTMGHQLVVLFLVNALRSFLRRSDGGHAVMSPFPIKVGKEKYREPDVAFLFARHAVWNHETHWDGADLVMEVVSDFNRNQDWVRKRDEYAQAHIPEYWIVDARRGTISVLRLKRGRYALHGEFSRGQRALSALLPGFDVDVAEALDAR